MVSMEGAPEDLGAAASPDEVAIGDALKLLNLRWRAIGRVIKGIKNASLRHAFCAWDWAGPACWAGLR